MCVANQGAGGCCGRGARAGAGGSCGTRGPRAARVPACQTLGVARVAEQAGDARLLAELTPKGRAREIITVLASQGHSSAAVISPNDQEAPLYAQAPAAAAGDREEGYSDGPPRRRY